MRAQWRERLEHCAGDDGKPPLQLSGLEKQCYEANPPEFGFGRPYRPQPQAAEGAPWPPPQDAAFTWYLGQYGWCVLQRLRAGEFIADRDLPVFHNLIQRWRHPNGLVWGMAIANYGHAGAWTESLGIIAPLQEMMLKSWDGSIRVFPAWPKSLDARFENLRAQGAFLVSAGWSSGRIRDLAITSEKGCHCRLIEPWPGVSKVTDKDSADVVAARDNGMIGFDTRAGMTYRVVPAP